MRDLHPPAAVPPRDIPCRQGDQMGRRAPLRSSSADPRAETCQRQSIFSEHVALDSRAWVRAVSREWPQGSGKRNEHRPYAASRPGVCDLAAVRDRAGTGEPHRSTSWLCASRCSESHCSLTCPCSAGMRRPWNQPTRAASAMSEVDPIASQAMFTCNSTLRHVSSRRRPDAAVARTPHHLDAWSAPDHPSATSFIDALGHGLPGPVPEPQNEDRGNQPQSDHNHPTRWRRQVG
jgi:hypothetical protein